MSQQPNFDGFSFFFLKGDLYKTVVWGHLKSTSPSSEA